MHVFQSKRLGVLQLWWIVSWRGYYATGYCSETLAIVLQLLHVEAFYVQSLPSKNMRTKFADTSPTATLLKATDGDAGAAVSYFQINVSKPEVKGAAS